MATSTGATITMETTSARDYYRRAGLDSVTVRGRPGVRRRANIHRLGVNDLAVDDIVELIVYPELVLRSRPWQFWGRVARFYDEAVVLWQLDREQEGTIVRIPYRYFEDGRVWERRMQPDE